jgi:hypothetical protein
MKSQGARLPAEQNTLLPTFENELCPRRSYELE